MSAIDRPVFIVGVDHSGTTILYRMMARHPELAWFSQYSLRGGDFPGRVWLPLHGLANRAGRSMFRFRWQKETPRFLPEPREGAGIWRRLIPRTDGFLHESDYEEEMAARVRGAICAELDAWKRERMLVKIPYLTRAIRLLDRIFPDALYIHIVRDGRAVALSNQKRFEVGGRGAAEALRISARTWVETLEYIEALDEQLGSRLLTMRYEEFCEGVHEGLRRAVRFVGLDPEALDTSGIPSTLHSTNAKWLERCSPTDRKLLDRELGEMLERWSYPRFGARQDTGIKRKVRQDLLTT